MEKKYIRKHFKFGIELELFTLDEKGFMSHEAGTLIQEVQKKFPHIDIQKECGQNIIEIGCKPHVLIPNIMKQVVQDLQNILSYAQEQNIFLYPFGTYPGAFEPQIYEDIRYYAQQKILGDERFKIAARCTGLHCHYTLPWGVFNYLEKIIRIPLQSKNKQSMINIYNLFIALDPLLIAFSQSSPFYQGRYVAKSSRVVMYRGGEVFQCPEGLFANYKKFGALPPYILTGTDLVDSIQKRFLEWRSLIEETGVPIESALKHGSILGLSWNSVRLNAHGTTEQRSMDSNLPSIIVALALLIKFIAKHTQENFVQVLPSDMSIKTPFKYENNCLYIPPYSYVRDELQPKAAFEGLQNESVFQYCAVFFQLVKKLMPQNRHYLLLPLEDMLKERKSMADKILNKAKELGVVPEQGLSNEKAAELALFLCREFNEDLQSTFEKLKQFKEDI